MSKVYVVGHRNPDTDSVTSAITLSYLKNRLGMNTVPAVLSSINKESKYALNYFNTRITYREIFKSIDNIIKTKLIIYHEENLIWNDGNRRSGCYIM